MESVLKNFLQLKLEMIEALLVIGFVWLRVTEASSSVPVDDLQLNFAAKLETGKIVHFVFFKIQIQKNSL